MSNLYLDIETIPSQSPVVHAKIAEGVTPPGNISKAETIEAWIKEKKPDLVKEAIAKTSFDGATGHVCCIGWAFDDETPKSMIIDSIEAERDMLLDVTCGIITQASAASYGSPTIIGHNIINFDIRFLWQRAIILGVRMPTWFPRDPKPWGNNVFDTMTAFVGARNMIGMDRLCEALGMGGKGQIDGSMVAQMWADGKYQEIADYCAADVERTRSIHRRMQIAYGEAA